MPTGTGRAHDPYIRTSAETASALQEAEKSRVVARSTRLQVRLEELEQSICRHPVAGADSLLRVLDAVLVATEAPMGNIQIAESDVLRIRAQRGFGRRFLEFFETVTIGESACGEAFGAGRPVVVDDVAKSRLYTPASRRAMLEAGALAVQSLPLITRRGAIGVVSVHYAEPKIPRVRCRALELAGGRVADVVSRCLS